MTIQTNFRQGEAEEKKEVVTQTTTTETNLWQGDLETEVETESNEALSEWEVHQNGAACACESAGNRVGGRAHSPTRVQFVLLLNTSMSSVPVVETQKSRWNVSGVDRCETGLFHGKSSSLSGILVFDPARCAHLPGSELQI